MQAKSERFEMRLDQGVLDKVDAWRGRQDDLPSRAEAMRRLMETGLGASDPGRLRFSDGDKLILWMLSDLHKALKVKGEIDADFVTSALVGGHYWALRWQYGGIFPEHEDDDRSVNEVVDILDMWSFMESAYAKLSDADKDRLKVEAEPFGNCVVFSGFDGNNEVEHLSIAKFLIEKMDRFSSFKGRGLNSHSHSLTKYRRMLAVFGPMRRNLIGVELNVSQLTEILKAKVHPDFQK